MGENFDAASERTGPTGTASSTVVAILINEGLANGEAVMAMDIRGPVLGAWYAVVLDEFGQILCSRRPVDS